MRGNFARENFGYLHAPLEWQEVVWENSRGGGMNCWVWTVAAEENGKAQIRDEL